MSPEELFYRVGLQERTQCSASVTTEYIERIRQEINANHNYSPETDDHSLRRNELDIKRMNILIILRVHLRYNPYIVRCHQNVSPSVSKWQSTNKKFYHIS